MKTTLKHVSVLLACAGLIAGCSTKPAAQPSAAPQDQTGTGKNCDHDRGLDLPAR